MNAYTFIAAFINEFASSNNYYSDIAELLDISIEEFVSNNSIEVNKKLICDISGDIFNAINLYRTHIGEIDHLYSSMEVFYQQLAHISIFVKFYPEIETIYSQFNEKQFIDEFVVEYTQHPECYDNASDLLEAFIDDYVSNNSFVVNKQIVQVYSADIQTCINLYNQHLGYIDFINTSIIDVYEKLAFVSLFVNLYPKVSLKV